MKLFSFSKSKKAISTIVGTIFFVVIMIGAFGAFYTAFQLQSDLFQSQFDVSVNEIEKIQERFLASSSAANNILSVNVENTGSVPIEIVDLLVINQSASETPPHSANLVDINFTNSFIPVGVTADILEGDKWGIKDGTYDLKIVSGRGNIQTINDFTVSASPTGTDCRTKAFVTPPNAAVGGNVTLVAHVTNTQTSSLFDVQPNGDPTVTPSTAVLNKTLTSPTSVSELKAGESFLFAWNYKLTGAIGSSVQFDVSAKAKSTSGGSSFDRTCNTSTTKTKIVKSQEDEILIQTLTAKPDIFAVIAGPIGESDSDDARMYFGAVIVNPTNQSMTVNRVSIMFQPSDADGNEEVVDEGEDDFDHIHPTDNGRCNGCTDPPGGSPVGDWDAPEDNAVMWTADPIESPITIGPFSAEQFVFKTEVDDLDDDLLVAVTINAYTSFGQFAKTGYLTHGDEDENDVTIVNVYPTLRSVTGTSSEGTADDNEFAAIKTISSGSSDTFYITVREGQDSGGSCPTGNQCPRILANEATLIINLPVGFPIVTAASGQTGFGTPTILTFQDGSQQIRVPITDVLGDTTSDVERFTFEFSATAPTVDETRMYIIYALVSGNDRDDNPLGAISEAYVVIISP